MIATLMLLSWVGWSCWVMYRAVRSAQAKMPVAAPGQRVPRAVAVRGLEDDADKWLAARGAWTALDERQLIRLLTDSAP